MLQRARRAATIGIFTVIKVCCIESTNKKAGAARLAQLSVLLYHERGAFVHLANAFLPEGLPKSTNCVAVQQSAEIYAAIEAHERAGDALALLAAVSDALGHVAQRDAAAAAWLQLDPGAARRSMLAA